VLLQIRMPVETLISLLQWLSYTLQKSRRGTARVASALVNRGLAYWDIPISSNADMGYDLTIANDAMVNKDKKEKTE